MDRDPESDARDLVQVRWPSARWAVLTGSVVTHHRTAGSDLDIVVLVDDGQLDDAGPAVPYRESLLFRGWPVELFVHDVASLDHYLGIELAARKPSLHRMLAQGVTLTGDAAEAAVVRRRCATVLHGGPSPLTTKERNRLRYGLTDLLDDLAHSVDPAETAALAATLWLAIADAACAAAGHWTGRGKWAARELRDLDPATADAWLAARDDLAAVAALAGGCSTARVVRSSTGSGRRASVPGRPPPLPAGVGHPNTGRQPSGGSFCSVPSTSAKRSPRSAMRSPMVRIVQRSGASVGSSSSSHSIGTETGAPAAGRGL
jgi:hypothetical protein